ncbi:MAG: 50S ribosomal protein L17 [Holosporales bacterium]|nr:50S ribosomal protein L17 [Holosporales bacterium]
MRHGMAHRLLNRTSAHRKAMFRNMICSLLKEERIKTTLPKAKELRPLAEKVITLGKRYQASTSEAERLSIRRHAIVKIGDEAVASKVLTTLSERFQARQGGYSRIVRAGRRYGDNAPMAVIALV